VNRDDELVDRSLSAAATPVISGIAVLVITVLGAPQVWEAVRSRDFGVELVFYPVLAAALGHLALRGRRS